MVIIATHRIEGIGRILFIYSFKSVKSNIYISYLQVSIVPTLRRGNSCRNALALRDARTSQTAFPRRSVGTIPILTPKQMGY
jgi:hypothetical protein